MADTAPAQVRPKRRASLHRDVSGLVQYVATVHAANDSDDDEGPVGATEGAETLLGDIAEAMVRRTASLADGLAGAERVRTVNASHVRRATLSRLPRGSRRRIDALAQAAVERALEAAGGSGSEDGPGRRGMSRTNAAGVDVSVARVEKAFRAVLAPQGRRITSADGSMIYMSGAVDALLTAIIEDALAVAETAGSTTIQTADVRRALSEAPYYRELLRTLVLKVTPVLPAQPRAGAETAPVATPSTDSRKMDGLYARMRKVTRG